jgi:hypothetical protein
MVSMSALGLRREVGVSMGGVLLSVTGISY